MWQYTGKQRPSFALEPHDNQESVWDYPRPPICVNEYREVIVSVQGLEIARSNRAVRVLETASPPTVYIPPEDVNLNLLVRSPGQSFCEWKGAATYWSIKTDQVNVNNCGWSYDNPSPRFERIKDYLSFYPKLVDCHLGSEIAQPQSGGFYGGWVTSEIVGPWKGQNGTGGW